MAREAQLDSAFDEVKTYFHYDEHTQQTHVEIEHDAEPTMDFVRHLSNERFSGDSSETGMRYLGEITPVVMVEWLKQGFDIFTASPQELRQWIARNRRDYGHLFVDRSQPNAGIIIKGAR